MITGANISLGRWLPRRPLAGERAHPAARRRERATRIIGNPDGGLSKVLGGNLGRLPAPVLKAKGYPS